MDPLIKINDATKFIQNYIETCNYRGPDGSRVWCDPNYNVTLGHNLLSIMATPKQSMQPWMTPKGNTLVYNGEIFNYKDKLNFKILSASDRRLDSLEIKII